MEEHGAEIEWLFDRSARKFIGRVTNTLHYLTRREVMDFFAASQGSELFYLTSTLAWLMKLCLLKEIGFAKAERKELMERHAEAQLVRTFWKKQKDD
jgi:hypothetical protein